MGKELIHFDPSHVSKFDGSFPEIYKNPNYVSLKTLSENHGRLKVKQLIGLILADRLDSAIEYNPNILDPIASNIVETYNDVTLEDIVLFVRKLVGGAFGDIYRYDAITFNRCFVKYYEQRCEEFHHIRMQKQYEDANRVDGVHKKISESIEQQNRKNYVKRKLRLTMYKDLAHYCEVHEYNPDIFLDQYAKQFTEDTNVYELSREQFCTLIISRFMLLQNKLLQAKTINDLDIKELCRLMFNHDIEGLVVLCRYYGIWGVRTPYCDFAKEVITNETSHVVFRSIIPSGKEVNIKTGEKFPSLIEMVNKAVLRIIMDTKIIPVTKVYVLGFIFNFVLDLEKTREENENSTKDVQG